MSPPQSALFSRDAGVCGDDVPDGYVVFSAFGTEFIVKQTMLEEPDVMRDAQMKKFLENIAEMHKNRTMYICVNAKNEVCVGMRESNPSRFLRASFRQYCVNLARHTQVCLRSVSLS